MSKLNKKDKQGFAQRAELAIERRAVELGPHNANPAVMLQHDMFRLISGEIEESSRQDILEQAYRRLATRYRNWAAQLHRQRVQHRLDIETQFVLVLIAYSRAGLRFSEGTTQSKAKPS